MNAIYHRKLLYRLFSVVFLNLKNPAKSIPRRIYAIYISLTLDGFPSVLSINFTSICIPFFMFTISMSFYHSQVSFSRQTANLSIFLQIFLHTFPQCLHKKIALSAGTPHRQGITTFYCAFLTYANTSSLFLPVARAGASFLLCSTDFCFAANFSLIDGFLFTSSPLDLSSDFSAALDLKCSCS